jgi:hypothetical protein
VAYVVVAMLIARPKWSPRDVIVVIAATAFCLTVVYFLLCQHYEEHINRIGLAIFGPAASGSVSFLAALTAAHLHLVQRRTFSAPRASTVTLTAILAVVTIHLWLYGGVAYHSSFIGRTAFAVVAAILASHPG